MRESGSFRGNLSFPNRGSHGSPANHSSPKDEGQCCMASKPQEGK
jgi:hypothetical protein